MARVATFIAVLFPPITAQAASQVSSPVRAIATGIGVHAPIGVMRIAALADTVAVTVHGWTGQAEVRSRGWLLRSDVMEGDQIVAFSQHDQPRGTIMIART